MNWSQEALEILAFHEKQQAELGIPKPGRPESLIGKRGWSATDTAKHFKRSTYYTNQCLTLGKKLRDHPEIANLERSKALGIRVSDRKQQFLAKVKEVIFKLHQDAKTRKLSEELRKALEEFE